MTQAFTYEVTYIIQILAESKEDADKQLEEKGGYISDRKVKFLAGTNLMPPVSPTPKLKLKAVPSKEAE